MAFVSLTSPSVNRKICFGWPFRGFYVRILSREAAISVPPISASKVCIDERACFKYASSYGWLVGKSELKELPKDQTLKNDY